MAITGMHGLLYTTEPESLRAVLRDAFGLAHVDAGGGWLIFDVPPAELGVHPAEGPTWDAGVRHLISFMCDDINRTIGELRAKGITVTEGPRDEGYGITAVMNLPGGCDVMVYEPRHPIAAGMTSRVAKKRTAKKQPAKMRPVKKQAAAKTIATKKSAKRVSPPRGRPATRARRRR